MKNLGTAEKNPLERFFQDRFHRKYIKESQSHLQRHYFKQQKEGEQTRHQRHSDVLLRSNATRTRTHLRELEQDNQKIFLKLSAVDDRNPIYSKEHAS